nr:uncharacterized protein LOC127335984 [Lolium perenne]
MDLRKKKSLGKVIWGKEATSSGQNCCVGEGCHLVMGIAPHRHVLASKRGIWHQNALDCCTRHQRRVEEQQGAAAVALDRTALATTEEGQHIFERSRRGAIENSTSDHRLVVPSVDLCDLIG